MADFIDPVKGSWADAVEEEDKDKKAQEPKKEEDKKEEVKEKKKEEEKEEEEEGKKEAKGGEEGKKKGISIDMRRQAVNEGVVVEMIHSDGYNPPKAESFESLNLKPELQKVLNLWGFNKPSPVQKHVLPVSLTRRNVIAQAPSGTGKTITFTVTILQNIDASQQYPQALIVSPTMELAQNIYDVVSRFAKEVGITTQLVVKEMTSFQNRNAQVIIGTPGKLDSVFNRNSRLHISPMKISLFVLDEADKMLASSGLLSETQKVRAHCRRVSQFVLVSATFEQRILDFATKPKNPSNPNSCFIPPPWSIAKIVPEGAKLTPVPKEITHILLCLKENSLQSKLDALFELFQRIAIGQTFIFANSHNSVLAIGQLMEKLEQSYVVLTGKLDGKLRKEVFEQFRTLQKNVCVCTNVGSRGLDIENCSTVVNVEIPYDQEKGRAAKPDTVTYIHRAGRCGRFGNQGVCFTFVTNRQERDEMISIFKECVGTDGELIKYEEWQMSEVDKLEDRVSDLFSNLSI